MAVAVNVEPFLRRLCERVCDGRHPGHPWPNSRISVSHVISRNTGLMAVIWKEVDDKILDNQLADSGGADRVVFTFTVCSPVRKHVSRMVEYLCNTVPYNQRYLWQSIGAERPAVSSNVTRLTGYRRDLLPENQKLSLTVEPGPALDTEPYRVQMLSCVNEGRSIDYNPGLDIWQGECLFISTMSSVREDDNA